GVGELPGARRADHVLGRPAVRRLHRPHRHAGGRLPDDPAQPGLHVPAAAGRYGRPAGPWTTDHDRPRARHQSLYQGGRAARRSHTRNLMTFQAPKGTFDWLPPRSEQVLALREALAAPVRRAGYGYVETPVFEDTQLFARGVGESTDIVTKEMYTFPDKAGRSLTLRPEGTASVVRAVLQHGLHNGQLPVKLWYSGSQFRYERAQRGRYRHFWQVGAEALGAEDPALDAELIVLASQGFASVGLKQVTLLVNSLGDKNCRPAYRAALQEFLRGLDLDEETRARIEINPLRVLDDRRPEVQAQLGDAPLVVDHLCAACKAYHEEVRALLRASGVAYEDDPRLVRGLDYYTRTTFEFTHGGLGSQSAIGGGGRYDGLSEMLGGPPLPSVGWAIGV